MLRVMIGGLLALGLAACGEKAETGQMPESGTMMAGDSMTMMAMPMLPRVQAHLDSLASPTPARHDAAMASHAMVIDSLVGAMQTDLMHMGMNRDAAYDALADSAVKDLTRIAAAPRAEQDALLQEHLSRVRRLMQFYETMIAKGK
ncbi:MAG: hypothetical protein ACT4PM_14020 [Gemmatimonadales bacterium]